MAGVQAIDTNTKILSKIAENTRLTMNVVAEFKSSVASQMDTVSSNLSNLGKSLSKSFSLNSLGSKIGETFNKGFKNFTAPFKSLTSSISSAFIGLKTKIANLNPIEAIKNKVKTVVAKPVAAVKTLFGKNDEQLKAKFFRVWSNPKKVAKIWHKELSQPKAIVPAKQPSKVGGLLKSAGGIIKEFVTSMFTALGKFLPKLSAWFHMTLGPYLAPIAIGVLLISIAIMGLVAILKGMSPVIEKVLNTVADIFDMIKGPIGSLLSNLIGIFSNLYGVINTVIGGVLGGIANTLSGIFKVAENFVDTVFKSLNMVSEVLLTLLTPIRDVVLALQPVFEGMVNLLQNFIKNPIGTATEVGKNIVSGFKSLVGGFFGSDTRDEAEGASILENLFTTVKDALIEVKDYLLGDTFRENLKSTFNYFLDKIYSSKIFKFMEDAFVKVFQFYDEMIGIIHSIKEFVGNVVDKIGSIFNGAGNFAKSIFGGLTAAANGFKNKMTNIFTIGSRDEKDQTNPFDEFIKGFEQMRKDTIALLTQIKSAVVNIEKSKIEIGKALSQNNGEVSDGKKTNNLQNITLNYQVDIDRVIEKMEETNKRLDGILTNTSLKDDGNAKTGAVWSI